MLAKGALTGSPGSLATDLVILAADDLPGLHYPFRHRHVMASPASDQKSEDGKESECARKRDRHHRPTHWIIKGSEAAPPIRRWRRRTPSRITTTPPGQLSRDGENARRCRITIPKTCLDLRQNRGEYLKMLRVPPIRQIFLLLLAVVLALGISQATVESEVMSLEMAKPRIMMADMPVAQCEATLPKTCDSEAADCMLTCAAPVLWMPAIVAFEHAPLLLQGERPSSLPSPMGMARPPNLPPPRTTDI